MAEAFADIDFLQSPRGLGPMQGLRYQFDRLFFATPVYGLTLASRVPSGLSLVPPDPWPGNAERGATIIRDHFTFGDDLVEGDCNWPFLQHSADGFADLHGFDWLRDLRAVGGDTPRRRARALVSDWMDTYAAWHPDAWRPDILGRRVSAWLGQYGFFCASADDGFRARYLDSLTRQIRHLNRSLPGCADGESLFVAIKGLILGSVALPGRAAALNKGLRLFERQLRRQFLPDGGHVSRCPGTHAQVLRHIVDVRSALLAASRELPPSLINAIDRAAPFLRMLRHNDGSLAMFNGGQGVPEWFLDMLLAQADARGRPPARAPHSGYERITANRALLLIDTGQPAPPGLDATAHAGTLSFELSVGKERIIVNCGHHAAPGPWARASRTTAAHSTLVVDNTNSTAVSDHGLGRGPENITTKREDSDGASWVEASHDGYRAPFGLTHIRRLYMSADGEDIRGQDPLKRTGDRSTAATFALRFHLHPLVQPLLAHDGSSVLLQLPSGGRWQFRASGGRLALGDSVYLGNPGKVEATRQIVVSGEVVEHEADAASVRWAIQRVANAA